jgi:hypothetical protein
MKENNSKLLSLYLKKVTKLTQRERVMVLCWLNHLIHPKIVVAPSKNDVDRILAKGEGCLAEMKKRGVSGDHSYFKRKIEVENIAGIPVGVNVIIKKDGKFYKSKLEAK